MKPGELELVRAPQVVRLDLRDGTMTKLTNDLASYGGIALAGDAVVTTRYESRSSFWIADATGRGERQIGTRCRPR
jgi:hypothetical protein